MNKKFMSSSIMVVVLILATTLVGFTSITGQVTSAGSTTLSVINWEGHGSENLPCEFGAHWVLAPAFNIDSAMLTVNGSDYGMSQNGNGSWEADSSGSLDVNLSAYVSYTGDGDERNSLQLSHCLEGEPTPTPTEPEPTLTPTEPAPTETPTQPVPTETPEDPTQTPTLPPPPTKTPMPPHPAEADGNLIYPSKLIGVLYMDSRTFNVYDGVKAEDGTLMLPSAERGAALYQSTFWVHRLWNSGWLHLDIGSEIQLTLVNGQVLNFVVSSVTPYPYGIYPEDNSEDFKYIASCYSDAFGNWVGVDIYELSLK